MSTFTGMLINKQNLKETYRQKDAIRGKTDDKFRMSRVTLGKKCLKLCKENKHIKNDTIITLFKT